MCVEFIILIIIIILILSVYLCICVNNTDIKEHYENNNKQQPLLKRTTKTGSELLNKTINIKDGGIYKKLLDNVTYDSIVLETDATHNLFIFLGYVGGNNGENYIRNPVYQNKNGMSVALNNINTEVSADDGTGNLGYEIALNEKLQGVDYTHIRGLNDLSDPVYTVTAYRSTILDNALQKHIYSKDQTFYKEYNQYLDRDGRYTLRDCAPHCSGGLVYSNKGNKYINLGVDAGNTDTRIRNGKSVYDNYTDEPTLREVYMDFNYDGGLSKYIKDNLSTRTQIYSNLPTDIYNQQTKIITPQESNNTINKYGYIPYNFNNDPYILSRKNTECELACGNNTCIKLTIQVHINEANKNRETIDIKEDIVKLMRHMEDNKIGYDNGLKYNVNGCQTYNVPYNCRSLGNNKSYPVYTERITQEHTNYLARKEVITVPYFYTLYQGCHHKKMQDYEPTPKIENKERLVSYSMSVPISGNALNHYSNTKLHEISEKYKDELNKWKLQNGISMSIGDVKILNHDIPDVNSQGRSPINQIVNIYDNVKNIIRIDFDRNNRIIKVFKCDSWDNNNKKCINPVLILTHGLSTQNKSEQHLIYYPELWVAFKEDLRQSDSTLQMNKSRYHNFENKISRLPINNDNVGINITIKDIKFGLPGFNQNPAETINYTYNAGKCVYNGDEKYIYDISQYPSYQESCKKECEKDILCKGFTFAEGKMKDNTVLNNNRRPTWRSYGKCILHNANQDSNSEITSSKFIEEDDNLKLSWFNKKYLHNIPENQHCYIALNKDVDINAHYQNINNNKIHEFKKLKYKPIKNYLNVLKGGNNKNDYPSWMNCVLNGDKVICNDSTTINNFVKEINEIRVLLQRCNQLELCKGGYKNSNITPNNNNTKIINTLDDITKFDQYDGHHIEYGRYTNENTRYEMTINTVYFVKELLEAYIVLFDRFKGETKTYKNKYRYIKEFEGPRLSKSQHRHILNEQTYFIVIPLFEYLSCTHCTPENLNKKLIENQKNQQREIHINKVLDKLKNDTFTCETEEIITDGWDNIRNNSQNQSVGKPRFAQIYPSIKFKGLRLRVKGSGSIHILIGNLLDNDREMKWNNLSVIPNSGSGIQISMDTHDNSGGLISYILKKHSNSESYEMLTNFKSKLNSNKTSNTRSIGGNNEYLPEIKIQTLNGNEINSVLGQSIHNQYDVNGRLQDIYQYHTENGVAGSYQNFAIDFDDINNKLYVLYKSSVSSEYSLFMEADVKNFNNILGNNYKLYVVSGVGVHNSKTHWIADVYRYENDRIKPNENCYDVISYKQDRPEQIQQPSLQNIPNYNAIGLGKCKTTSGKRPPYRSIDIKYNPLTNDDLDLRQDNDQNRLAAFKACSAFCSPEPIGVNKENDCIGFELSKHWNGYLCKLFANKSHRELGLRRDYYSNGYHNIPTDEECINVCDNITQTYRECDKRPGGCDTYNYDLNDRCYARDNANILTEQQLNEEKQLKASIEQTRRQEMIDKMNEFKQKYNTTIIKQEPEICEVNKFISRYNSCICPNEKPIKYTPLYDNSGNNINPNKDFKCGTENDIPQSCGIREVPLFSNQQTTNAVNDPTCVCSYGRFKVNDNGNFWCDLPRNEVVNWSDCIPSEENPKTGKQFKSTEVSFLGQGAGKVCADTNQGRPITIDEQTCTPTNLPLDYWIKAFRNAGKGDEKGCNSSWFTESDDYTWDKYKNGIDYYNDNKDNNFDYQYLLNWAEARLNEGHGVCNNRWRGPEGKCVATWEKTNVTDDYYTCQTDSGQCILQTHNKKQTEMDPDLIDIIFDKSNSGKQECESKCPTMSYALNDEFTNSVLPDNAPKSWYHGSCENVWTGGKRHVYWVCEQDKGTGVFGVKPVLLTEDRARNDPTVNDYISNTKEEAIIKCTPLPPEYEGPQIDYHDHISYIGVINDHFDSNELARFPNQFANESTMKQWHDANPTQPHIELYGDKLAWFEEYLRYKTRNTQITFDPNNKKCQVNMEDINKYESPRKHFDDYINAGHPEKCKEAKEIYNNMNELESRIYDKPEPELGEIFYVRSTNTAYEVVRGRNGGFIPRKWDTGYNWNNTHPNWPNNEYNQKHNYSMKIVPFDINCVGAKDKTKLNFFLKWGKLNGNNVTDNNDNTLSFHGYAHPGGQILQNRGGTYGPASSLYNCAEACREHPECKYFTYYPGGGSGYFKGYGPASIYPSNSYPRTYHGSSYGGVPHEAASRFYDPFSPYNQPNYNGNSNLFGFYRRGKKHLTSLDAKKMNCTWATGIGDRDDFSIDNDTHIWPITMMSEFNKDTRCEPWGCRGNIHVKAGTIPGLNEDLIFPYWFFGNNRFNFLENPGVDFPKDDTETYKKLRKIAEEHPHHIRNFDNHVNNMVKVYNDSNVILQQKIKRLDDYKKQLLQQGINDPNYGNIPQFTKDIENQRKNVISSKNISDKLLKEKKLKDDKREDAKRQLPIISKKITDYNKTLFNKIPVGNLSPFQRYNSDNTRNNNGPKLLYLVPPMVSETVNGITENNIAVYRHSEINIANTNRLGISCDNMMDNNDKLNHSSCRHNPNQPCNTNNILSGTVNYKNINDHHHYWQVINRNESGRVISGGNPACELFNFNVDDPIVSQNDFRNTISGVLTDRDKYTGSTIRSRQFHNYIPNWAENNSNVDVKQIGKRYLVTADKTY